MRPPWSTTGAASSPAGTPSAGGSDAEFIGKQVTLAIVGVEHDGARIVVAAEVGGNGFNGSSHFGFDLDGHKITRMTIRA
jgi:hypothetical protein